MSSTEHEMADNKVGQLMKRLSLARYIINSTPWKLYRHRVAMRKERRINSHFTGFNRLPTQFEALAGPVLDHVDRTLDRPLRIVVVGCSNGAEAYTISKVLKESQHNVRFEIIGCDIEDDVIETARRGLYDAASEVYNNKKLPREFVDTLFTASGESFEVKPAFMQGVSFRNINVLDAEKMSALRPVDIVFAQNFLFHLSPKMAAEAFDNIASILGPRSALFIDGTDVPLRTKATRKHGLSPLTYKIETIHDEAMWTRGNGWPYQYWGLEPYGTVSNDLNRRYSTIFLRD